MSIYNSVAVLNPLYQAAHERWALVDALMDGRTAMLDAGYIQKELNEPQNRYESRLSRTSLTNFYARTIRNHAGKLFAKDIETEGFSSNMQLWLEDINLDGHNLTKFAHQLFVDAYNKGVSFILTDMQQVAPIEGRKRTAADDLIEGVRPYLVHIPAANVIDYITDTINGKTVLIQWRYFEDVLERVGEFEVSKVRQVKVLEPGRWRTFRKDKEGNWQPHAEGSTGIGVIPLTAYYTNRGLNNYVGSPPLEDLADKTLQYYQQENDLDNNIHFGNVPMLQFRGSQPSSIVDTTDSDGNPIQVEKSTDILVGPNCITYTGSKDEYLEVVEPKGSTAKVAMERLKLLQQEMELIGLAPMVNTARTATEAALNSFEIDRSLQACATSLEDALEQALLYMNEYPIAQETVGSLTVNKEYGFNDPMAAQKQGNALIQGGNKVQEQDVVKPTGEVSSEDE